jgi:hypothetical protein
MATNAAAKLGLGDLTKIIAAQQGKMEISRNNIPPIFQFFFGMALIFLCARLLPNVES